MKRQRKLKTTGVNDAANSMKSPETERPWLEQYRWQPGQSGNPKGRPKSLIGKALLRRLCRNNGAELKAIVEGIINAAKAGDSKAFTAIFDRIDGKPTQALEHSGANGEPVVFRFERIVIGE